MSAEEVQANNTIKKRISDFLNDTITLDVMTLTGKIELTQADLGNSAENDSVKEFNWDTIFSNVAEQMTEITPDSAIQIAAYTHAEWDQDSVNFVATGADPKLVEAHGEMVSAAHEARMNGLKSIADAVKSVF